MGIKFPDYCNKVKDYIQKIIGVFRDNFFAQLFLVFTLFFLMGGLMYLTLPRLFTMDDPMFHIRFAALLVEKGPSIFSEFPWLHHSDIAQEQKYFIYYNFLFYLALTIFSIVKPLYVGLQLYGIVSFAGILTALYYVLSKLKISYRLLWILLFVSIFATDLGRLFVARPFVIAPMLMILQMLFLYQQRKIAAVVVSMMYIFWHPATFFLPLLSLLIYYLFLQVFRVRENGRIFFVTTIAMILGVIALFVFPPGFFLYMRDIIFGIYTDTIVGNKVDIAEGAEVYPVDFISFVLLHKALFFVFIISVFFEVISYLRNRSTNFEKLTKRDALRMSFFFLSILFFLGTFFSRRFLDFFIFFSFTHVALIAPIIYSTINIEKKYVRRILLWSFALTVAAIFLAKQFSLHASLADVSGPDHMYPVMHWIDETVPDGDIIFHPTWDWFPQMFYHNPTNNYIVGIEPRFLYKYDPELYWAWQHISQNGYVCHEELCEELNREFGKVIKDDTLSEDWIYIHGNNIADYVIENFNSHYIIVSDEFNNLKTILENSERYDEVYNTPMQPFSVYRIKDR